MIVTAVARVFPGAAVEIDASPLPSPAQASERAPTAPAEATTKKGAL